MRLSARVLCPRLAHNNLRDMPTALTIRWSHPRYLWAPARSNPAFCQSTHRATIAHSNLGSCAIATTHFDRGSGLSPLAGSPSTCPAILWARIAVYMLIVHRAPFIGINELKHCLDLRPGQHGFFFFLVF